ncbi:MAG TPA: NUDIX hydrolase, partial [Kofleriaceae bacterium]|nr:NUDIX hydrolase [Kofleriaceae bacterium]
GAAAPEPGAAAPARGAVAPAPGAALAPKIAVAALVFDDTGRVLLIERAHAPGAGLWTVPGGRLEFGEALEAAVRREIEEETGLVVEVGELVAVVERCSSWAPGAAPIAAPGAYHYVILDYLARQRGGVLRAGSDARQARFFTVEELGALPLTEGLLPVLARGRALWAASESPGGSSPGS